MKIDRARAQKAFADYAAHYNAADAKVKLKIDHTYRVAALCARIAQSLALPPEDVDLAWLSGILHDVGRFEQLRRYNTFIDAQSVSHAALSVAVLFDEGRIRDYLDDAGADALLHTAVEWHSAFRLPEALDDRTRLFCQILRDADKIDILRVNVETPMEEIYVHQRLPQLGIQSGIQDAADAHLAHLGGFEDRGQDFLTGFHMRSPRR